MTVKEIYNALVYGDDTHEYYETCYGEFVVEAIENTLKDLRLYNHATKRDIPRIHRHITENYI